MIRRMSWDLIGHDWAVNILKRAAAQDNPRHAYLITGPEGVGRRTLAGLFARALICEGPADARPCGQCRPCRLALKGVHPDLPLIVPEVSGKKVLSEKIKIDTVRQLIYDLNLRPVEARRRVARLINFEAANDSAQNAFLKTLEEPPAGVVVIVTAATPEALLPTIVSRCEHLALRPLPVSQVAEALIMTHLIEAGLAGRVSAIAAGRPGLALRIARSPEALEQRAALLAQARTISSFTRVERFALADKLAKGQRSDDLQDQLELWASLWRDVLLAAHGAHTPPVNADQADDIRTLAAQVPAPAIRGLLAALARTSDLLEQNVNARLALEVLMLDWPVARAS
jgi:DNA polymerase-3 subunit delta'